MTVSKASALRLGGMAHATRVALQRAPTDRSGFWIVTDVQPGRGMSSMTYAHHDVGAIRVYQQYYTPGPYDALAYGPNSELATPRSTYFVWTGLAFGQPDDSSPKGACWDDPETWAVDRLVQVVTEAVGPIPLGAQIDVWSPDGEGALYLRFSDEGVEEALQFAQRMDTAKAKTPESSAARLEPTSYQDTLATFTPYDSMSNERKAAYDQRHGITQSDRQRIDSRLALA